MRVLRIIGKIFVMVFILLLFGTIIYATEQNTLQQVLESREGLYVNEKYGFSIVWPKGWFKHLEEGGGKGEVFFTKRPTRSLPMLALITDVAPENIQTALAFTNDALTESKEMAKQRQYTFKLIEAPHEIEINGLQGAKFIYEIINQQGKIKTIDCKFMKSNLVVSIQGIDYSEIFQTRLKDFEKAINSFVFIDKPRISVLSREDDEVGELLAKLGHENFEVRIYAAGDLIKIGSSAVGPLISVLQSKNSNVREQAAYSLGRIRDKRAVEPLIVLLRDENSKVRKETAKALGKIGDSAAVKGLISALKDRERDVRWNAVVALGKIGDRRAVEALIGVLKNKDVMSVAARALGKIGDLRAVEPLITAFEDKDTYRGDIAYALGDLGDLRAVEPLIATLKDENVNVRLAAVKALGQIGDVRAKGPLTKVLTDSSILIPVYAAWSLYKLGDSQKFELLISALKSREVFVALNAIHLLGETDDPRAIEALENIIQDNKSSGIMKGTAEEALEKNRKNK